MAQPYTVSKWTGPGFPRERDIEARLIAEGLPSVVRAEPPGRVNPERHRPYAMTLWLFTGILTVQFVTGNGAPREVVLRPGDRLDTRPEARFSYRVEGDGYAFYFLVTPFALPLSQRAPEPEALPADLEQRSA